MIAAPARLWAMHRGGQTGPGRAFTAERKQEGFLMRGPHFQGERQGQLLPRGRMADVMGVVPRRLIRILKARAHAEQCSDGLRRFLEAGHTLKRASASLP